jgi:carboxypeptidase C (cathepsin A)
MTDNDKAKSDEKKNEALRQQVEDLVKREWIETSHEIEVSGTTLSYTATVGVMPLQNDETTELDAGMFFTAYTLKNVDDTTQRPLLFAFNGGPGSSSVWLHLGAVGPKRARMEDEGWLPVPPYKLVDNPYTWLEFADLVFIDPVGTGYSRAVSKESSKKYWQPQGDIKSVGEFIRLYLARTGRWGSPLYLAGESYGTTRAAGLAGHLAGRGIVFNGIILISTIINFQTADFEQGNDLPFALFLPSYAAAAWYHRRLPDDLQAQRLRDVLDEVQAWAESDYSVALMKGSRISGDERAAVVECLSRYTGLSKQYVDLADLRINIFRFCKELLRDERRTIGRLDSRFTGIDATPVSETPEFDPSLSAITPPYTMLFNQYIRNELGFETDIEYEILSFKVNGDWEWERGKFPDTSAALRDGFNKNPHMRVFVAQGYYDLATPYLAAEYSLSHMGLDVSLMNNIVRQDYHAGHMFYIETNSLTKLKEDIGGFIE